MLGVFGLHTSLPRLLAGWNIHGLGLEQSFSTGMIFFPFGGRLPRSGDIFVPGRQHGPGRKGSSVRGGERRGKGFLSTSPIRLSPPASLGRWGSGEEAGEAESVTRGQGKEASPSMVRIARADAESWALRFSEGSREAVFPWPSNCSHTIDV